MTAQDCWKLCQRSRAGWRIIPAPPPNSTSTPLRSEKPAALDEAPSVLSATSPDGGAEGNAPEPQPFELPSDAEAKAKLGG